MQEKFRSEWYTFTIFQDVAASEFKTEQGNYDLDFKTEGNDGSKVLTPSQLTDLYASFASEFPIVSIEDPFDQDDWSAYQGLVAKLGKDVQIVGDDLLVTNPTRG